MTKLIFSAKKCKIGGVKVCKKRKCGFWGAVGWVPPKCKKSTFWPNLTKMCIFWGTKWVHLEKAMPKSDLDSAQIRHKNHSNILIQFPPYLSDSACKFIFHSKCYQHRNFIGVPHRFECIQAKSGRGTAWKWICIPNNRFWAGLRPSLKTCRVCSEFGKALSDMGWVPRNQSYSTICCLK